MPSTSTTHRTAVDSFFTYDVKEFTDFLASLEDRLNPTAEPVDDSILEELTAAIHKSREQCAKLQQLIGDDAQLLAETQKEFRERIAPWFDQSWFMQRAKEKPRGYPGDYGMLTAIYDGQPKSTGFGGYLDRYFLGTDLARAVCSRLEAIRKFLISEVLRQAAPVSILNVASGPGREYVDGFSSVSDLHLTCVDTDEQALQYLREHVSTDPDSHIDLNCVQYNALKMTSPRNNLEKFGQPDMIYSVGLCDYIPDRYLIRILDGWRQSVGEDGIVYVAFKDTLRYHASEYQWHVDWHFYQRTEEDCRELFAQAGYDTSKMEMFRDETEIIMNFIARSPALQRRRVDAAEQLRGPHTSFDSRSRFARQPEESQT